MKLLEQLSHVLSDQDLKKLFSIKEELTESWNKKHLFRTETEARFVVLNESKFPTKASRYWQSLREQMMQLEELVRLSFVIRRNEIKLRKIEHEMTTLDQTSFDYQLLEVDKDELLFHLGSSKKVAEHRIREIFQWSLLKKENNDGSFDDKDVNSHQKESLFQSVYNRAQITSLTSEEQLSVNGILYGLASEPKNRQFLEQQKEKK